MALAANRRRYTASLLHLDPDLGPLLTVERFAEARTALTVVVHALDVGPWDTAPLGPVGPGHIGLFVVDGALACQVLMEDSVSTELLGPGDVVRPWGEPGAGQILQHDVTWTVLSECHVAILDRQFATPLSRFPEVNTALLERISARGERLAVIKAIAQLNRVDRRLLALLWHLAERWGRVTADGVALPLILSHRVLGEIVGARRPTISTALGELARSGDVLRRPDGTWVLRGEPPGAPWPQTKRFVPSRRRVLAASPDALINAAKDVSRE